ncbi:hypothetical protein L1987_13121 [Smallanthus sonchifolius]|uniref:Uncharacterized protein n=1 Tax=Smallanthus sonchifolius TaxID=185202 RepID=A0ACB9JFP0_9ASTR|nr:hypothetical protein L1987_13121 [Smallanthus sonchifolius]
MIQPSHTFQSPVLTLINKRIRNLKKKLNRIAQLEESIAQGKSAIKNKEEELLKSKPSILAAVDEQEKFRQPLMAAVDEEISLAVKHSQVGTSGSNNDKEVDCDDVGETLCNEENEAVYPKFIPVEHKKLLQLTSLIVYVQLPAC